jgi:hypothetical protein
VLLTLSPLPASQEIGMGWGSLERTATDREVQIRVSDRGRGTADDQLETIPLVVVGQTPPARHEAMR